ncbi:MAG: tRNA (adenosine(37)-N6)-dimethylallyltransferase MiaA [Nitrospirae bacterium]|nr:MAG: tRNA (adenosine(37)-N6)-dimethylallyltransferase MiaA [Nitrospirota bacterium]
MSQAPVTRHVSLVTSLRPLIALVGPTAVGKSRVAVLLAKVLGTDVLTADSRQVYRGMDIGMDKPSLEERLGVPHRLIDLVEPDQPFNVGAYRRQALREIERLYGQGKIPLVVGGTGLYVRTLLHGLWNGPPADWSFRERLVGEARVNGAEYLHHELARVDPESAERLHPHDHVKIIRALEVHHLSGHPLSESHRRHAFAETPFASLLIGLTRDRAALYRRIDERVDEQLAKGLVQETRGLLEKGYGRDRGSMKGLGYRQIAGYLAGDYPYEEAVRLLKRDTRHFAKRQMTWFRKEPGVTWMEIGDQESLEKVSVRLLDLVKQFLAGLSTRVGCGDEKTAVAAG